MKFDHIIKGTEELTDARFHLSCGFYENTYILFEKAGFYVNIHNKGTFTFCAPDYRKLAVIQARPMDSGRGCYMDILITTTEDGIRFQFPEYTWTDHYPHCDGESDRWDRYISRWFRIVFNCESKEAAVLDR